MGAYDSMGKPKKGPSKPKPATNRFARLTSKGSDDAVRGASWAGQQQMAMYGQPQPFGGSYGGSGGSGGGGGSRGGGGGGVMDDPYKEYRAQLEAKLNELKGAVPGALNGYLNEYNSRIGQIIAQNAPLTQQYSNDIGATLQQILGQAGAARNSLQTDLMAQGADTRALGSTADLYGVGAQQMSGAADMYNQRLAQIQQLANADRQSMGAAINQSAQGQLENEYLRALAQIQTLR